MLTVFERILSYFRDSSSMRILANIADNPVSVNAAS
jgi:hypothetical protein